MRHTAILYKVVFWKGCSNHHRNPNNGKEVHTKTREPKIECVKISREPEWPND